MINQREALTGHVTQIEEQKGHRSRDSSKLQYNRSDDIQSLGKDKSKCTVANEEG